MFDRKRIDLFEARSVMLFATLTLGTASATFAQSSMPEAPVSNSEISAAFATADKDASGSLSREEAKSLPAVAGDRVKRGIALAAMVRRAHHERPREDGTKGLKRGA